MNMELKLNESMKSFLEETGGAEIVNVRTLVVNVDEIETVKKGYKVIYIDGVKTVDIDSVSPVLHITIGTNSKTGKNCATFNFPIGYSCDHTAECFKSRNCYGMHGCFNFSSNQKLYSENFKFWLKKNHDEFVDAFVVFIKAFKVRKFRYFAIGDTPNSRFIDEINEIARRCPEVKFWTYTKKHGVYNQYVRIHGGTIGNAIAKNLVVVFSIWCFEDGTRIEIDNPFNFPTSIYIPFGYEHLINENMHVCPCSDPTFTGTCSDGCTNPCYEMAPGDIVAFLAHSLKKTKERDGYIHKSQKELKTGRKKK